MPLDVNVKVVSPFFELPFGIGVWFHDEGTLVVVAAVSLSLKAFIDKQKVESLFLEVDAQLSIRLID